MVIHIDQQKFEEGHQLFKQYLMKKSGIPFITFDHPQFLKDETEYKLRILKKARITLHLEKWNEWISSPGKIIQSLREVCKASGNLLEHSYDAAHNSDGALYNLKSDQEKELEEQFYNFFLGGSNEPTEFGKRFDSLVGYLEKNKLKKSWPFLAYLSFLVNPGIYFPILPLKFDKLLQFYGINEKISREFSWKKYSVLLELADELRSKLANYGKLDAIQVQSYMWVISTIITDGIKKEHILDDLESKGVSKTHIQILKKFLILSGQIIEASSQIRGNKGKSPIPPDSIVSVPHYLHNLVRGVYKPEGDSYALSIQTNPNSKWGTEIDFDKRKWSMEYDFGDEKKYASDIESMKKCYENNIPIGIIYKRKKGVNEILGLGSLISFSGTKFQIVPYEIDENNEEIREIADEYAKEKCERNDFSSQGSERTVLTRSLTQFFKKSLFEEYDGKCAFCDLARQSYLIGSHIVPHATMKKEDQKNAMNPSDGLLLCKLCDIAFENGDILVKPNYDIEITENLKNHAQHDSTLSSWLSKIKKKIPVKTHSVFKADPKYLIRKLELVNGSS